MAYLTHKNKVYFANIVLSGDKLLFYKIIQFKNL